LRKNISCGVSIALFGAEYESAACPAQNVIICSQIAKNDWKSILRQVWFIPFVDKRVRSR